MNDPTPDTGDEGLARMGKGMLLVFWLVVGALLTWGFNVYLDGERNPNRDPETVRRGDRVEVILERNRANHYVASGTLNGQPVEFLLDTGATDVAIPESLARRLDLPRGPSGTVMTANGPARAYRTVVDRLTLGGIVLEDVRASVLPGLDDTGVLLGMSALSQLELRQKGDTLTLIR